MSRIFLSHSSKDNFAAAALRDWLASEGWDDVFLDIDQDRGIAPGERWERALHAAAARCEAVLFLISADWLASDWCRKEHSLARGLNKKLFALAIDANLAVAALPQALTGTWQIVDLVGGQKLKLFPTQLPGSHEERHVGFTEDGLLRLKRGLERAGLDPRFFAWPPVSDPDRAPYRGPKPLESEDAGVFFGRDAPIVETIDRLRDLAVGAAARRCDAARRSRGRENPPHAHRPRRRAGAGHRRRRVRRLCAEREGGRRPEGRGGAEGGRGSHETARRGRLRRSRGESATRRRGGRQEKCASADRPRRPRADTRG